ncbi:MAG: redoxin domain-containing protein [Planctomycetota bacterium]|nr:redoxin domain-containing protein [Planctomycetota bacterium]
MKHPALIQSSLIALALVCSVFADDTVVPTRPTAAPADAPTAAPEVAAVGATAPDFTLKGADGKDYTLASAKGKVIVLQWINPDCPVCRAKSESGAVTKMVDDARKIDPTVVFYFINSTKSDAENPSKSAKYLAQHHVDGPALIDGDGKVGHLYGAKSTPHCYVIDATGMLAYAGAIDDKGELNYVVNAVQALKDGKQPSPSTTKAYGCPVKYGGRKRG